MKRLILYVHGKGGYAAEAEHYRFLFADSDVVGFDYKSQNPWESKEEFPDIFRSVADGYNSVILVANSIGAFLSMYALGDRKIEKALFISPIVNMEKLIADMMVWANVTEEDMEEKKEITTEFGETLSWDYLCYVRENPIEWRIPTQILYGENDHLTSIETISEFASRINAPLTVMKGGEHWFHTEKQMDFLDNWIRNIY